MKNDNGYQAPQRLELGDVVELTKGDGASDKWDVGSGYRKGCNCGSPPPV
ncbi:MAG: hypothetical protein AAGN66_28570 [Acidobacteriota bacterium]